MWSLFSEKGQLLYSSDNTTRIEDTYVCDQYYENHKEHPAIHISYENLKKHARTSLKLIFKNRFPFLESILKNKHIDSILLTDLKDLNTLDKKTLNYIIENLENNTESLNDNEKSFLISLNDDKVFSVTKNDELLKKDIPALCCNVDYRKNNKTLKERNIRHLAFDRKYRSIEDRTREPKIWYEEDTIFRACGDKNLQIF